MDDRIPFRRLQLCKWLHAFDFTYAIPRDGNRFEDGVNLRYRFGYERGVDQRLITVYLDDAPCSMLEMMVALCLRCEEQIMSCEEEGDRTGEWFDKMLHSLGISEETDKIDVYDILSRFIRHDYAPDGHGGLFTLPHCRHDMRTAEIWYQAMWYFDEVLQKG